MSGSPQNRRHSPHASRKACLGEPIEQSWSARVKRAQGSHAFAELFLSATPLSQGPQVNQECHGRVVRAHILGFDQLIDPLPQLAFAGGEVVQALGMRGRPRGLRSLRLLTFSLGFGRFTCRTAGFGRIQQLSDSAPPRRCFRPRLTGAEAALQRRLNIAALHRRRREATVRFFFQIPAARRSSRRCPADRRPARAPGWPWRPPRAGPHRYWRGNATTARSGPPREPAQTGGYRGFHVILVDIVPCGIASSQPR